MSIDRALRRLLCAAVASLAACVSTATLEANAHAIVVHAVLDAGARVQDVHVQTTNGEISQATDVSGAVVGLTLPGGRTVFATQRTDTVVPGSAIVPPRLAIVYRFSLDALGFAIVPGATYALRVQLPDGRAVTGRTTTPQATPVLLPSGQSQGFDLRSDTVSLSWARVPAARSYEVSVSMDSSFVAPTALFADTTIQLTGTTVGNDGSRLFASSRSTGGTRYRLLVSAVDSNYYDYYRRSSDLLTGVGVVGHLDGAYGLFGSIVVIATRTLTAR